ncbi:MAG: hypothetical protein GX802_05575, partial [Clostridiales bacterium]|nr:hypothetical protein [Clostridiales bacterium]
MKRIRILLCLSMVFVMLMAFINPAFATEATEPEATDVATQESAPPASSEPVNTFMYGIEDLMLTVYVPSNYTTVTKDTPSGSQEFVDLDLYEYEVFLQTMEANNQFLYAQDINSLVEISLYAWASPENIQDFRECLDYELKKIAKDSMENFNSQGVVTYNEYEIKKLEHISYITFEGTYNNPDSTNLQHSFLAVSYIKGNEIQIEMLSNAPFTDQQISDIHKMLENSVTPEFSSNRLLMETLRFVALGALGIALIVVILVFISSQSKVKKMEREALRQAREQEAQQEASTDSEMSPQPKQDIKMAY